MNRNQLILLVALVVAVGLGGLLLNQKQQSSWAGSGKDGGKLLPNLPVDENLAQIHIRQGTNSVTLEKQSDVWTVRERGNHPANYAEITRVILKLRDLKPVQTEQIGASQLGRLQLLPPGEGTNTATLVEFRDAAGKELASLRLGKTQMRESGQPSQFGDDGGYPVGRWVMVGDAKDTVALVSDPLSDLEPSPTQWLNKDFIKVEKIKSIALTHPEATNSWSVSRTSDTSSDWTLAGAGAGEKLDSGKTGGFGWALSSPSFNDVLADANPADLGLDQPSTLTIETFDGLTYTLKVGTKTDDAQPVTVSVTGNFPKEREPVADESAEDKARRDQEFADTRKQLESKLARAKAFEKWTYLLPGWTLDSLLKNRADLLAAPDSSGEGADSAESAGESDSAHAHDDHAGHAHPHE